MEDDLLINDLVSQWKSRRQRGEQIPLEQLCRDTPELLERVRAELIIELICEWEDRHKRGEHLTANDMCGDTPGLIEPFRDALRKIQFADDVMGADTQPSGSTEPLGDSLPSVTGFEVLDVLGRGGMGVVFKARQLSPRRLVALKMIRSGELAWREERQRFQTEADALARLNHPNIVTVYEVGDHNGLPYFTLEFVEGGSLAKKVAAGPLPPREAARLVEQVARGVAAAHSRGIVHRDLKPANVLLARDGTPKITDFGLAKETEVETVDLTPTDTYPGRDGDKTHLTRTGVVMGTLSYMPPEQARGEKTIGPPADIWALGAILYELLVGRPPFLGASPIETMRQVCDTEAVAPRHLVPTLPRDLDTICLKCLRKEAGNRYASAAELADDLCRFLEHKPILARPVGRIVKIRLWCRRNPVVAGLAAALIVAVTAGTSFGAWQVRNYLEEKDNAAKKALLLAEEQTKLAEERDLKLGAEQKAVVEERAKTTALTELAEQQTKLADERNLKLKAEQATAAEERAKTNALTEKAKQEAAHTETLEERLYHYRVTLAYRDWYANRPDETKRLLNLSVPAKEQRDRRNWEWHYVNRLTKANQIELQSHVAFVPCVAWSPNGRQIASGDDKGIVKLWLWLDDHFAFPMDLNGKHTGEVKCAAFSPNGRYLATGSLPGHKGLNPFGANPNERGEVKIWDLRDFKAAPRTLPGGSGALAWSADSTQLATDGSGRVQIWDAATGAAAKTIGEKFGAIDGLAYSPDGKRLAAVTHPEDNRLVGLLKVWDVESGKELVTVNAHAFWAHGVAWSPDGKLLVTCGGDRTATIWEAETGKRLQNLWGHRASVHAVAFSPNGKEIATAGVDGLIKIWYAETGEELHTLRGGTQSPIWSIAYRPDGKRLVSSGFDFTVRVCDPRRGSDYHVQYGDVYFLAVSPDGRRLVAGGQYASGGATVWGLRSDRAFDTITTKARFVFQGHSIRGLTFSADGKHIASASYQFDHAAPVKPGKPFDIPVVGEIKIWNADTGAEEKTFRGHQGHVQAVALSHDGKLLASGGEDGLVKIWKIADGKELLTFNKHAKPISSLAFRRDGLLASAAGEVIVWDPATGKEVQTFRGHKSSVIDLAFSPDGKRIASAGTVGDFAQRTGEVKVWEVDGGKELMTLTGHARQVNRVAFSPDGRRLATASEDKTVKVWDLTVGLDIITLSSTDTSAMSFVAFTPDGLLIAGGAGGIEPGRIIIWDGRPSGAKPFESMPTDAAKAAARVDLDKLQGAWRMVSVEDDGAKPTEKQLEGRVAVIEGDKLRFKTGDQLLSEYTLKIDPTYLPKEIDLVKGKTASEGIYHLDGDDLKLCLNQKAGEERPTDFSAPSGSSRVLMVFKRVAP